MIHSNSFINLLEYSKQINLILSYNIVSLDFQKSLRRLFTTSCSKEKEKQKALYEIFLQTDWKDKRHRSCFHNSDYQWSPERTLCSAFAHLPRGLGKDNSKRKKWPGGEGQWVKRNRWTQSELTFCMLAPAMWYARKLYQYMQSSWDSTGTWSL